VNVFDQLKPTIMSYSLRNYRHRNPKTGDEQKTSSGPFFQSPKGAAVQRKKGSGFFQRKVTVGKPGDVHEKEADSMANKVVQRLATSKEDEKIGTHDARMEKDKEEPMKPVQTKQAPGEKKDKDVHKMDDPEKKKKGVHKMDDPEKKKKGVHKMDDPEKKKKGVHKKEENTASPAVAAELERQSGKGSPLPADTLAEMSQAFGMDFSHVRIHHDSAAVALCVELNAQAFTQGCDIYFNEGKYNPESSEGKRLLAHELTHVAQQNG
jgi:Domain of unknown function (DUF4157)